MSRRLLGPVAARGAISLAATLLAGCGGTAASVVGVTPPASGPISKAQAVAYARVVNLRAGDLPGFTGSGSESEAPEPGQYGLAYVRQYGLEYVRCRGGVPARRIANVRSTEFSAGPAFYGKVIKSRVEVWPTPALVALNTETSHSSRGRACLVHYLDAVHRRVNRERHGRRQIGSFTINTVPNPLPGVSHSSLTTVNETRLLRTGAVRAHIYRDIFQFISGAAEVELEAVGFGHPVPASIEGKALQLLLGRARANTI